MLRGSTRLSRLPRGLALRHIVPRAAILSPSRTLCNASDTPAREPSEATLDPVVDAVPTRPRDILSPDDESKPQPYTKMQRAAIGAGCAACFSGGALSLGWQHWAFMQPYLVDVMGLSLIGASVVLGREAFLKKGKKDRSAAELPERDGGWNLELIPLNDEARYAAAAGALQAHLVAKAAADDAAKAGKLDAALAAAEKEAKEQAEASRKEKAEALIKEAADEVAAGLAPCAAPRDPLPRTHARTHAGTHAHMPLIARLAHLRVPLAGAGGACGSAWRRASSSSTLTRADRRAAAPTAARRARRPRCARCSTSCASRSTCCCTSRRRTTR